MGLQWYSRVSKVESLKVNWSSWIRQFERQTYVITYCSYTVGPGELKPPQRYILNAAQNKYVYLFKYHQLTKKKISKQMRNMLIHILMTDDKGENARSITARVLNSD